MYMIVLTTACWYILLLYIRILSISEVWISIHIYVYRYIHIYICIHIYTYIYTICLRSIAYCFLSIVDRLLSIAHSRLRMQLFCRKHIVFCRSPPKSQMMLGEAIMGPAPELFVLHNSGYNYESLFTHTSKRAAANAVAYA